jgi:small subunit ribosomal protein S2
MGGMRMVKKMPDALLIVDIAEHLSAVREAKRMGIPVVAISDTNTDPTMVTHPIPANDKSALSISFIFDYLAKAINEGKEALSAEKQA